MKSINALNCLKLDSFGVETSFSKSRTEYISFFNKYDIPIDTPTAMQIVVKSKLLSLDIDFFISFLFDSEKLIAITISPDQVLDGAALYCRYGKIQKALENELGHPNNRLRSIMNFLDPDNRLSYWQKDGVKIEHYLINRFDMEEIINIKL